MAEQDINFYQYDPARGWFIPGQGASSSTYVGGLSSTPAPPPSAAPPPATPSPQTLPQLSAPNLSWLQQGQNPGLNEMLQGGLLASQQSLPGLLGMPSQQMQNSSPFYGAIPWGMAPEDARQLMLSQAQRAFAEPPVKTTG
jgi:hypothetical protein